MSTMNIVWLTGHFNCLAILIFVLATSTQPRFSEGAVSLDRGFSSSSLANQRWCSGWINDLGECRQALLVDKVDLDVGGRPVSTNNEDAVWNRDIVDHKTQKPSLFDFIYPSAPRYPLKVQKKQSDESLSRAVQRLPMCTVAPLPQQQQLSGIGYEGQGDVDWSGSQSVCPSRAEWSMLRFAKDIHDIEVEIFQQSDGSSRLDEFNPMLSRVGQQRVELDFRPGLQWFYTVSCEHHENTRSRRDCPGCCTGIDRTRYLSNCRQRKSLVLAIVRRPLERRYRFDWIHVNSSCSCAVVRRPNLLADEL